MASRSDSHDKSSEETYVSNLRLAAEECQKHNIQVLIEPISTVSDYYLQTYSQALDILKKVDHHNLKIEFDFYHAQRTQGNLLEFIKENLGSIGHIQVAQVPGRHEPDQEGEINYQYVFKALREMGYSGWIGAEYHPRGKTEDGLAWMSSIN